MKNWVFFRGSILERFWGGFESFGEGKNPPKTFPKSFQNRRPKKHAIFHRFLFALFRFFDLRFLGNVRFTTVKPLIRRFSQKSRFFDFPPFFFQKTYPKPLRNEVRTLQKSMLKTCWFSTWIFLGFGLDLGGSWASKMEPSWPKDDKNN